MSAARPAGGLGRDRGRRLAGPRVAVPTWLQWVAFAVIGVQVGLRFDRASLVAIGRMLPVVC